MLKNLEVLSKGGFIVAYTKNKITPPSTYKVVNNSDLFLDWNNMDFNDYYNYEGENYLYEFLDYTTQSKGFEFDSGTGNGRIASRLELPTNSYSMWQYRNTNYYIDVNSSSGNASSQESINVVIPGSFVRIRSLYGGLSTPGLYEAVKTYESTSVPGYYDNQDWEKAPASYFLTSSSTEQNLQTKQGITDIWVTNGWQNDYPGTSWGQEIRIQKKWNTPSGTSAENQWFPANPTLSPYIYIAWHTAVNDEDEDSLIVTYQNYVSSGVTTVTYTASDFEDNIIPEAIFIELCGGGGGGARGGHGGEGGGGGAGSYWCGVLKKLIPETTNVKDYSYRITVGRFGNGGTANGADTDSGSSGGTTILQACTGESEDEETGEWYPDWDTIIWCYGGNGGHVNVNGVGEGGSGGAIPYLIDGWGDYVAPYYSCAGANGGKANDTNKDALYGGNSAEIELGNPLLHASGFSPTDYTERTVGYFALRGGYEGGKTSVDPWSQGGGGGGASMFAPGAKSVPEGIPLTPSSGLSDWAQSATLGAGGAGGDDISGGGSMGGCGGGGVAIVHLHRK